MVLEGRAGLAVLGGASSGSAAVGATHQSATACIVPRMIGLTLDRARARARHAGCKIRLAGATVEDPAVQTVARQSLRAGTHRRLVTLRINPLCDVPAEPGPPAGEPFVTPGPSELISGLYLVGGSPARATSEPKCPTEGIPTAGTIVVTNPSTGAIIATQTVGERQLAKIPLPPGTYTISGTLVDQHAQTGPVQVTIPADETVRQDLSWGGAM